MRTDPHRPLLERFWEKVQICEHGLSCMYCCWPWQGSIRDGGYGQFARKIDGKWKPARSHRLAWELMNKQVMPPHLSALHHCDNPPCCNGMHIYPGTQLQNAQDAMKRGQLLGRYHGIQSKGESRRNAKLNTQAIHLIFQWHDEGLGYRRIAKKLNVSPSTISAVLKSQTWNHVSQSLSVGDSALLD